MAPTYWGSAPLHQMFDIDRSLINVNFESYKLDASAFERQTVELPAEVYQPETEYQVTQFQVLADGILRNLLFQTDDDGVAFFLKDGSIMKYNGELSQLKSPVPLETSVSATNGYYSIGCQVFSTDGKPIQLPNSPFNEYPIHLTDASNEYIMGYQVVPSESCDWISLSEDKMGSSIFLVRIFKADGTPVVEYFSWTRPLILQFFKESILLGSPSGFYPVNYPVLMTPEPSVIEPIIERPDLLDDRTDEQEEEELEESQINHLILRSFLLEDPKKMVAASPPMTYLASSKTQGWIALQNGVDMVVFQLEDAALKLQRHIFTLNAFAFIQSGKQKKKFVTFQKNVAVLAESFEAVYVYKMDSIQDCVAKQYLISFPGEPILGIHLNADGNLLLLLPTRLEVIKLY